MRPIPQESFFFVQCGCSPSLKQIENKRFVNFKKIKRLYKIAQTIFKM